MANPIARIVGWPLRLLLPAPGRHRATGPLPAVRGPAVQHQDAPTVNPSRVFASSARPAREEEVALVRPYLIAHERRQKARRQRQRRRTLWLAVHGVDIGSRWIHGVRVAAR